MAASTAVNDQHLTFESDGHAKFLKTSRETLVNLEAQGFRGVETAVVTPSAASFQQLYNMRRVRRTVRAYIQRMQLHYLI
jgi:hypothetical protein